jgi:hypothetical protein
MTHANRDQESGKRGRLARERAARRLSLMVDARRRLNAVDAKNPAELKQSTRSLGTSEVIMRQRLLTPHPAAQSGAAALTELIPNGLSGPKSVSDRSVRRANARRASTRRAVARDRKSDTNASVVDYLAHHARSTAGDIARGLSLKPISVSAALAQLMKSGRIRRASRGYRTK